MRYVSALDVQAFAAWRSSVYGNTYHLPTEQQWEKAAGWNPQTQHQYTYGFQQDSIIDCNYSNYSSGCYKGPIPVGSFNGTGGKNDAKSYYGCYDMSGNVWEWTSSLWANDPCFHVIKGGFWAGSSNVETGCTTTLRHFDALSSRVSYLGFRLVLDVN